MILREYMRAGDSLVEAVDRLVEWAAGVGKSAEEREAERIARENDAELRRLQSMFGGAF